MEDREIHQLVAILETAVAAWPTPAVTVIAGRGGDAFAVLVSCILSLRTQDATTALASHRLLGLADSPAALSRLPLDVIERAIYPVGFYRNKSVTLRNIAETLERKYGGEVPRDLDELVSLKGVGRKTANLVLTLGFGMPGICVDTHVHRIFNRLGYVATKTPDQTEQVLRQKLPPEYWIRINDLLVTFGQNQCTPLSPRCSTCPAFPICSRIGVGKSR